MEANEALDILGGGGTLDRSPPIPGLSRGFFERIFADYASAPERALRLAQHWQIVLRYGDDPAWTHRGRALAEMARGRWRASAESFLEAGRLQKDGSWTFALPAVDAFGRAGDLPTALQTGERLRRRFQGNPVALARLNVNVANVYEQADRLREAHKRYQNAVAVLADKPEYEVDFAKALAGQAAVSWQLGRVAESREASLQALEIFERTGQTIHRDVCLGNLAEAAQVEGRLDEAARTLAELRSRAEGPRAPWLSELLGFAYRSLNLIPESIECFQGGMEATGVQRVGLANTHAGLGLSLRDLGQDRLARMHLDGARRLYGEIGNRLMPALMDLADAEHELTLGRFAVAANRADSAGVALKEEGDRSASLRAQFFAAEARFMGPMEVAPPPEVARALASSRDPQLVWRGHYLAALATSKPLPKFRLMLDALLEARLMLASPLSRAAFWGDKRRAVEAFLGYLIRQGSRAAIAEAFDVLSRVRSATLIDEILASTNRFEDGQRTALATLRSELNLLGDAEGIPQTLRAAKRSHGVGQAVSRRWHETAGRVLSGEVASVELLRAPGCASLVAVGGAYHALTPEGVKHTLPCSITEIDRMAADFRFECMEPLVDPKARERHCTLALEDLARACFHPWAATNLREVCPEDGLWSIPWQAFPLLAGEEGELALRLTPLVASLVDSARPRGEGVAIWIGATDSLPNIARERDLLRRLFPEAIVCESREEVLRSMSRRSVELVHVSAHGRHQNGNPMFSYIDFSDGPLYAAEIAAMGFRTRRAVLLSCESGRVSIPFRREPDGIARAFLARGAEEIVGSSWLLHDDAALDLFSELYSSQSGLSLASSLARARRKLREKFAHPFYWAGPVLLRGYGLPGA